MDEGQSSSDVWSGRNDNRTYDWSNGSRGTRVSSGRRSMHIAGQRHSGNKSTRTGQRTSGQGHSGIYNK